MTPAPVSIPPPQVFRAPLAARIGVSACAVFIGALALFLIFAAGASFTIGAAFGLFMALIAAIMTALAALVVKEAVSRWRLYARLEGGRLIALLPRRRGFIDQERVGVDIAVSDYDRIETRLEVFSALGVTTAQRAYALVKPNGERFFLGADREMLTPFFEKLVNAIVSRTGLKVADLGMVDGNPGFLLVARQSVPDWSSASLSEAEIEVRNRRRARTPQILIAIALTVTLARALGGH